MNTQELFQEYVNTKKKYTDLRLNQRGGTVPNIDIDVFNQIANKHFLIGFNNIKIKSGVDDFAPIQQGLQYAVEYLINHIRDEDTIVTAVLLAAENKINDIRQAGEAIRIRGDREEAFDYEAAKDKLRGIAKSAFKSYYKKSLSEEIPSKTPDEIEQWIEELAEAEAAEAERRAARKEKLQEANAEVAKLRAQLAAVRAKPAAVRAKPAAAELEIPHQGPPPSREEALADIARQKAPDWTNWKAQLDKPLDDEKKHLTEGLTLLYPDKQQIPDVIEMWKDSLDDVFSLLLDKDLEDAQKEIWDQIKDGPTD